MFRSVRQLALFGLAYALLNQVALADDAFSCSSKDSKAIDTVSKDYFQNHSAALIQNLIVSSQRCAANYASANIRFKHDSAIQSNLYLKKMNKEWQVIVLGTKLSADLAAAIPEQLRQVTEDSTVG